MSKRLFVGGLPYDMTEEKLQEIFTECGRVEKVKIMVDRGSGRSKGFGFVEMATDLEGNAAILKFDNAQLGNRKISVKEARPAEERHKPASGQRPSREQQGRGRQQNGRPPREKRFSNHPDGPQGHTPRPEGSFGEGRPPRNNHFGESRPPRNNNFGGGRRSGGFGRSNGNGQGEPAGFGGGDQNRRPHGRGPNDFNGNFAPPNRSDWRTELGLGTGGQPVRRDQRRNNHQRDQRRFRGPMDDNFGNR